MTTLDQLKLIRTQLSLQFPETYLELITDDTPRDEEGFRTAIELKRVEYQLPISSGTIGELWAVWQQFIRGISAARPVAPSPSPTPPRRVMSNTGSAPNTAAASTPAVVSALDVTPASAPTRRSTPTFNDLKRRTIAFGSRPEAGTAHNDRLSWSVQQELEFFAVVGGESSSPAGLQDGRELAVTVSTNFPIDASTPAYVSVFGFPADPALEGRFVAVALIPRDVEHLTYDPYPGRIDLRWGLSSGVDGVDVRRSRPGRQLGELTSEDSIAVSADLLSAQDDTCLPGETYTYRVRTLLRYVGSGLSATAPVYSAGEELTCTVPAPESPVEDFEVTKLPLDGGKPRLRLTWRYAGAGVVEIHRMNGRADEDNSGFAGDATEIEALVGARLTGTPSPRGDDRWVHDGVAVDPNTSVVTFSPVVVMGDGTLRVERSTTVVLPPVLGGETEIQERLDYQLLRVGWPEDTHHLRVWSLAPMGQPSGPGRVVDRIEYDRFGGVIFSDRVPGSAALPASSEREIHVRASVLSGGKSIPGPAFVAQYPGRLVFEWQFSTVEKTSKNWRGQTVVEGRRTVVRVRISARDQHRPWPDFGLRLIARTGRPPLWTDANTPDPAQVRTIFGTRVEASKLPTGTWIELGGTPQPLRPGDFVGGFTTESRVIVVGEQGRNPLPAISRSRLPPPLTIECPRCAEQITSAVQVFRCSEPQHQGDPTREVDPRWAAPEPAHYFDHYQPVGALPAATVPCDVCEQPTSAEHCPHCLYSVPSGWWSASPLALALVGATGSGKTTYEQMLMSHLESSLARGIRAPLMDRNLKATTRRKQSRVFRDAGVLPDPTSAHTDNHGVLDPSIFALGRTTNGRERSLVLFDVAGEDMATQEYAQAYGPMLIGADVILLQIDPKQIPEVRQWLRVRSAEAHNIVDAAVVVDSVVSSLRAEAARRSGMASGAAIDQPVAVIFGRFDELIEATESGAGQIGGVVTRGSIARRDPNLILTSPDVGPPTIYDTQDGDDLHHEVRSIMMGVGGDTFLHHLEAQFRTVRYFAVSSLGHRAKDSGRRGLIVDSRGVSPLRVGDPVRWAMSTRPDWV